MIAWRDSTKEVSTNQYSLQRFRITARTTKELTIRTTLSTVAGMSSQSLHLVDPERRTPMQQLQVRVPEQLAERLDQAVTDYHGAGATGVTRATLVREAVGAFLSAHEQQMEEMLK